MPKTKKVKGLCPAAALRELSAARVRLQAATAWGRVESFWDEAGRLYESGCVDLAERFYERAMEQGREAQRMTLRWKELR